MYIYVYTYIYTIIIITLLLLSLSINKVKSYTLWNDVSLTHLLVAGMQAMSVLACIIVLVYLGHEVNESAMRHDTYTYIHIIMNHQFVFEYACIYI